VARLLIGLGGERIGDTWERGLSQVPGPTRIRPDLLQWVLNSLWLGIDTQLLRRNKAIDYILT
jgi:hypothetical protein